MTQDEIIEMAKQAGICSWLKPPEDVKERLEAFAKLVAAKAIEQRTWQGLTDEEKHKTWYEMQNIMGWYSFQEIANAIEAKLKEKNSA